MKILGSGLCVALAVVTVLSGAPAEAQWRLTLDPEASTVAFSLQATGHKVTGTFGVVSGEILVNPETHEASGIVEVDARSGDSDNSRRDEKMHREVLRSDQFSMFRYVVEGVSGDGCLNAAGSLEFDGRIEVLGQSHPLALSVSCQPSGDQMHASAEFEVPFVDWGLKDPSVFVLKVAKTVLVTVQAVGWSEKMPLTAPSTPGEGDE